MNTNSDDIRVSSEKQLRIGVFSRRTEAIEEKLIARQSAVTLGATPDCTIALPYLKMERLTLFQPLVDGRYALCFTAKMSGVCKTKNKEHSLQECIEQGLASKDGDVYRVTLPLSAQGRIELEDAVILFSFVPVRLKNAPLLSRELRPEFFSSRDRPFIALLGLSFLLHAGVAWMANTRIVPQQEPLFLEETLAGLMIHQPTVSTPDVKDPPTEKIMTTDEERPLPSPSPAVTHKPVSAAVSSDEPEDGRVGLVAVLGRQSADGGPFSELFGGEDPLAALDGVPKNMKAAKDSDELGAPLKKGPQEESGKLSELDPNLFDPNVPTETPISTPKKEKPIITLKPEPTCKDCEPLPPEVPNPGDVLRPYKGRIQACYERELPNNEGLAGKLTAEFSLSSAGRVIAVKFTTDTLQSEPVSSCVAGVLRSVKFPSVDEEVTFSVSFIFDKQ